MAPMKHCPLNIEWQTDRFEFSLDEIYVFFPVQVIIKLNPQKCMRFS